MNYWLMKSEPHTWHWDEQVAEGEAGTEWDGVRNYQARNVMRRMRLGDRAFFYHSGAEKRIVGIVEVSAESHPDSTDASGTWDCVDVRAVGALRTPVTLSQVRAEPSLSEMVLVRNSRLSVQPVAEAEWRRILELGGLAEGGA